MRYKQYTFNLLSEGECSGCDATVYLPLLSQELADRGFETFEEYPEEKHLIAYVSERSFESLEDEGVWCLECLPIAFSYHASLCASENWNSRWEAEGFAPFALGNELYVRAPYHRASPRVMQELLLEPRCAFGSGAHHTTQMMLSLLLEERERLAGARLLDVGCGTGVLGIAAALFGAERIDFVDIDATAVENAKHNTALNGLTVSCSFYEGILDELTFEEACFGALVANIHRNIILHDLLHYRRLLCSGGLLLISGFYQKEDAEMLRLALEEAGFRYLRGKDSSGWAALAFIA